MVFHMLGLFSCALHFFFILGEIIRLSHFNISTQTNALHIFFGIRVPIIEIAYSRSVSTVSCREIPYEKYGSCLRKKKRTGKALSAFWEDVCIENFFFLWMVTRCKEQGKVCTSRNPSETNGSRQLSLTTSRLSLVTIYFRKLSMIWLQHCSRDFLLLSRCQRLELVFEAHSVYGHTCSHAIRLCFGNGGKCAASS